MKSIPLGASMGFSDKYLEKMQENLQPGSSALVALVERAWGEQVAETLAKFEGQVLRQALTDDMVAQLMSEPQEDATNVSK